MKSWFLFTAVLTLFSTAAAAAEIRDAARGGDIETVRTLLTENPALVNDPDERNCTPLHFAAGEGETAVMELLLDCGAEIEAIDVDGDTPLHWGAISGQDGAVKLLLEQRAIIDSRNHHDDTPLLYAAKQLRLSTVKLLVESGADPELPNDYDRTPLLWVAREGGDLEMARLLLELGADPNALDRFQDSPLSLAAWRGFHELVGVLLDAGARTDLHQGMPPQLLGFATEKGGDRLYMRLVRDGAVIDIEPDRYGRTILHRAAAGGSAMIVKDLLDRGAAFTQRDLYGWTPLHYAADRGRRDAALVLIKAGAPLDRRTGSGWSPLSLAKMRGTPKLVQLLEKMGAESGARLFPRLSGSLLGQGDPPAEAVPFAPDMVATCHGEHGSISFSPDGREAYWSGYTETPDAGYGYGTILFSKLEDGRWTPPAMAGFAEERMGYDVPFFAPDGKRLYFLSRRPLVAGQEGQGENIWFVEKQGDSWGEPRPLSEAVNRMPHHWQFSVAANGNLYFSSRRGSADTQGIYLAKMVEGEHGEPEFLGFTGGTPLIAPDESWLITFEFRGDHQRSNVIRFRGRDGDWGEPIDLSGVIPGGGGICPKLSPDGEAFLYVSQVTGSNNNFWVDAGWLDDLKRRHLGR